MTNVVDRGGPTLAVVARAAGVSVPTVSKVLNDHPDVASGTRRRVEDALRRLHYVPPRRRWRPGRELLEVVFPAVDDAWAGVILGGINSQAQRLGVATVVTTTEPVPGQAPSGPHWLDAVRARRGSGVILPLGELTDRDQARLDRLAIPYVLIDPVEAPPEGGHSVGVTNWAGARSGIGHLLELGHRRIAIITGPPHRTFCRARLDGYRSALAEAGVPVSEQYVRDGRFDPAVSYRATLALLDLPDPPTALFVCTDRMVPAVYDALHQRGVRVPEQLSVVGFDDLPEARWAQPHLTTVRQPLTELAGLATRLVVGLSRGEPAPARRIELSTTLVVRASTAQPAC